MHITYSENAKEKNQWFKSLKVKFIQNYTFTIIHPSIAYSVFIIVYKINIISIL